jgi:hypothetical protein
MVLNRIAKSLGNMALPTAMALLWGLIACRQEPTLAPFAADMSWDGHELKVIDSVPSRFASWPSAEPLERYFQTDQGQPQVEIAAIPFEKPWQAYQAWQTLPGERSALGEWVRVGGAYALVAGRTLIWIQAQGSHVMSAQDLGQLRVKGWSLGKEPAYSGLFLQRYRTLGSGWVLDSAYLGLAWQGPLYGMQYAYLGDTVYSVVAGPQDSSFFDLRPSRVESVPFAATGEREGQARLLLRGGQVWVWHWGPEGLVLLQGCSAEPICQDWASRQYEALGLFESDGFFRAKNAPQN